MFVDKEKVLEATNQGLDIILKLYPDAVRVQGKKNAHFKARDERTASATMRIKKGVWHMTDHGADQKERNAIDQWMYEHNCTFEEALTAIAKEFHIEGKKGYIERKAEIRVTDAGPEDKEGDYKFDIRESGPTDGELAVLFADQVRRSFPRERLIAKMALLNCFVLDSYSIVKNRKITTILATDDFPIFLFEPVKGLKKIYKPKEQKKNFRFIYYGDKPKDIIFNLSNVQKAYDDLQLQGNKSDDNAEEEGKSKEKKLSEIIVCSGDSDSLNVAVLGYNVVWLNSETSDLSRKQFNILAGLAEKVMYLGDIDVTGKLRAHEQGLKNLKLHLIRLPDSLLEHKDWRGNPCKDGRDYLKYYKPYDFKTLVKTALPYQFWDESPQFNRSGEFTHMQYKPRNTRMYNFLANNGFFRLATEANKDGFKFVYTQGNIVEEMKPSGVKDFINRFLEKIGSNDDLRDAFYRTTQLGESSISNLPYKEMNFQNYEADAQYLFFQKKTWKVTAAGIVEMHPAEVDRHVWKDKVLPYNVKVMEDFWKVWFDQDKKCYRIKILNDDCILLKFLERTCRIHWRVVEKGVTEIEPGTLKETVRTTYTEEELLEQEQHLINRLYTLGYMMHRYKEKSKAWATWALEHKITDADDSKGGSGKSIFMSIPGQFQNMVEVPARDPNYFDNKHWNENIDEYTDYVHFDDASRYMKFDILYPNITGQWTINPKNTKSFIMSFKEGPKMGFSSNFPPRNATQSTERRLLYTVFSDYYHHGPNDEFDSERNPNGEFGMDLFDDFNEEEWNLAINTVAQCIRLFLSSEEKMNPPMDNVTKRNLKNTMGDAFHAWADTFFDKDSGNRNKKLMRRTLQDDFKQDSGMKWSPQQFKRAIEAWCKYNNLEFNPREMTNEEGRIIDKVDNKTEEMFYISDGEDDLPF